MNRLQRRMARLNGWQRLWMFVSVLWGVVVLAGGYPHWPTETFEESLATLAVPAPTPTQAERDIFAGLRATDVPAPPAVPPQPKTDPWAGIDRALPTAASSFWDPEDMPKAAPAPRRAAVPVQSPPSIEEARRLFAEPHETAAHALVVRQLAFVGKGLAVWTVPMFALYAFAWGLVWVRRGFTSSESAGMSPLRGPHASIPDSMPPVPTDRLGPAQPQQAVEEDRSVTRGGDTPLSPEFMPAVPVPAPGIPNAPDDHSSRPRQTQGQDVQGDREVVDAEHAGPSYGTHAGRCPRCGSEGIVQGTSRRFSRGAGWAWTVATAGLFVIIFSVAAIDGPLSPAGLRFSKNIAAWSAGLTVFVWLWKKTERECPKCGGLSNAAPDHTTP
jgi:hypothetical protein